MLFIQSLSDIIIVSVTILFLLTMLVTYIYKLIHKIPLGECGVCKNKGKKLIKLYHRTYKSK